MATTTTITADVSALQALSVAIAASVPDVIKAYRQTIQDVGGYLIGSRAMELSQWSKKIPRTIRWNTRASGLTNMQLTVLAGYKSVPIAKWYELGHTDKSTTWRHPVWPGHAPRKDWRWVVQAKGDYHRPYLYPALQQRKDQVAQVTIDAMVAAVVAAVPYFSASVA
jgi:hypothetical protein